MLSIGRHRRQSQEGPSVADDLGTLREIRKDLAELERLGYVVQHPGGRWDLTVKGMAALDETGAEGEQG